MCGHLTELTTTGRYAISTDRGTAYIDAEEARRMGLQLRRADDLAWLPFDDAVMRAVVRTLADTDARET
jgi:hypothetical protein